MDPKKYEEMRQKIRYDSPVVRKEYSLLDLFNNLPRKDAQALRTELIDYNKTLPKDKQFYDSQASNILDGLAFAYGENKNSDYWPKYFHPKTTFQIDPNYLAALGYVRREKENQHRVHMTLPGLVTSPKNTLLHEGSHVDAFLNPRQGYFLGEKVSPIQQLLRDIYNKVEKEKPRKSFTDKNYFPSGNSGENIDEMRANLRAGFGEQPMGTTMEEYLKPILDELYSSAIRPYVYDRNQIPGDSRSFSLNTIPREDAAYHIERDLFPRERWIEPRKPTIKERLSDLFK